MLGLSRRPAPPAGGERRRNAAASSFEAPAEAANPLQFGRAYQLPPFGHGNGLDALFWTPLAELAPGQVDAVLEALRARGIPAWAAPARRETRPTPEGRHDLWVASGELNDAQEAVMRALAERR
ncbi:hypothetical protein QDR37_02545 [Amnibacterium sp. CER49]|uniref:hypothetical protein n=1 Tax=Amnibacterium sp. CER49 TaxID=3039161 RepID=UPI00244B4675|nr:hypothetical protein [Amnibacterium sp. CER49]MDH2442817.1 hypothetical protein [Amnibacterium sp. CER49]